MYFLLDGCAILGAESGFSATGFSNLMPELKSTIEKSALKKFEEFHPNYK